MARTEIVTFTNMCMVEDSNGNVVVQQRCGSWPGIAFPGGHVEPGESFTRAVIREVQEETGLTIQHPHLVGIKDWTNDDGSRYVVLLYRANEFTGTITSSDEGEVWWHPIASLNELKLSASMSTMLQVFLDENLSEHLLYREGTTWKSILL